MHFSQCHSARPQFAAVYSASCSPAQPVLVRMSRTNIRIPRGAVIMSTLILVSHPLLRRTKSTNSIPPGFGGIDLPERNFLAEYVALDVGHATARIDTECKTVARRTNQPSYVTVNGEWTLNFQEAIHFAKTVLKQVTSQYWGGRGSVNVLDRGLEIH